MYPHRWRLNKTRTGLLNGVSQMFQMCIYISFLLLWYLAPLPIIIYFILFVTDIMIGVVFTLAALAVRLSESEDLK